MKKLIFVLVILVLFMTAGVVNAALLVLDDFSSVNGGTGWGADWVDYYGNPLPVPMNLSTASPFNDNISNQYRSDTAHAWPDERTYAIRTLATPPELGSTPDVWVGIYLRPVTTLSGGWAIGLAVTDSANNGIQVGFTNGDVATPIELGDNGAPDSAGDGTSQFTLNQPTLLVLHFYKSGGGPPKYNTVDLYADLDGTDGRYNSEVAIAIGYGSPTMADISAIQLIQEGFAVDFDYVAVGTTKESVTTLVSFSDPVGAIAPASINLTEDPGGTPSDTYTITLTEQPPAGATFAVRLESGDLWANGLEQVTISPLKTGDPNDVLDIEFDSTNWSPVTVTLTTVDDLIGEPQVTLSLNNSLVLVSGSVDPEIYPNWAAPWLINGTVSVSIEDNELRYAIVIDELDPSGIEVSEQGATSDTFSVVLKIEPTINVTVDIVNDGQTSLSSNSLAFNSGNWDTAQTVIVTAVDDTDGEDDPHLGIITSSISVPWAGSSVIEDFADEIGLNVTLDPDSYVSGGYLRGGPGLLDKPTSSLVNDGAHPPVAKIDVAFNMLGSTEAWAGIIVQVGRDGRTGSLFDGLNIAWYPAEGLLDIMEIDEGFYVPGSGHYAADHSPAGYDPSTDYLMTVVDYGTSIDVKVAEVADPGNNFIVRGIDVSGYTRPGDNIGVGLYYLAEIDLGGGIDEIAVTDATAEEQLWLTAPVEFVGSADGNASVADNDCTSERSATLSCDISGPDDVPDCRCDLYDLASVAAYWAECRLPNVPGCI